MENHFDPMLDELQARWDALSYDDKEAATAIVFQALREVIKDGGTSFRGLIYEYLDFGPQSYTPLYLSGGMDITNNIPERPYEAPAP